MGGIFMTSQNPTVVLCITVCDVAAALDCYAKAFGEVSEMGFVGSEVLFQELRLIWFG